MSIQNLLRILALTMLLTVGSTYATAQCPMCKVSAESNLKNGGTAGSGLNAGILYLFATPYLVIATIGYIWYRNRKEEKDEPSLN